jgi:hypothetical protein
MRQAVKSLFGVEVLELYPRFHFPSGQPSISLQS